MPSSAKSKKKITIVREHPLHVPVSNKNPIGITIRDQHQRRLTGTSLGLEDIKSIFKNYNLSKLIYPNPNKLDFPSGNQYDTIIAVWTDYFNQKFNTIPPLHPNVVKALIASESGFQSDPPGNKVARGIAQITKQTFKTLQDPNGEAKDFIFYKIRQKDLLDPDIAIPLAIRWLFRKKAMATQKLKRASTTEELILEYKGLLKSKTDLKDKALTNFRKNYDQLEKK